MYKEITKTIIAVAFVGATIVSFFCAVNPIGEELIRIITGIILYEYFKAPVLSIISRKK